MANGPEHYRAAEQYLARAAQERARADGDDPELDEDARALALEDAELDMKAAHVHAMLAVAAATVADRLVAPPSLVGGSQRTKATPEWDVVSRPTRAGTGENDG